MKCCRQNFRPALVSVRNSKSQSFQPNQPIVNLFSSVILPQIRSLAQVQQSTDIGSKCRLSMRAAPLRSRFVSLSRIRHEAQSGQFLQFSTKMPQPLELVPDLVIATNRN